MNVTVITGGSVLLPDLTRCAFPSASGKLLAYKGPMVSFLPPLYW